MAYRVEWSSTATKDLKHLDAKTGQLIRSWVRQNLEGCENPWAVAGGKALQGRDGGWRYRVGKYRILVTIFKERLVIRLIRVGHRQGVYKGL